MKFLLLMVVLHVFIQNLGAQQVIPDPDSSIIVQGGMYRTSVSRKFILEKGKGIPITLKVVARHDYDDHGRAAIIEIAMSFRKWGEDNLLGLFFEPTESASSSWRELCWEIPENSRSAMRKLQDRTELTVRLDHYGGTIEYGLYGPEKNHELMLEFEYPPAKPIITVQDTVKQDGLAHFSVGIEVEEGVTRLDFEEKDFKLDTSYTYQIDLLTISGTVMPDTTSSSCLIEWTVLDNTNVDLALRNIPVPLHREYYVCAIIDSLSSPPAYLELKIDASVGKEDEQAPEEFTLFPNFPNPFNTETTIEYDLPEDSYVELTIYNILGQKMHTLVNEEQKAHSYSITWEGLDDAGQPVATGIYIYEILAGSFVDIKKMLLIR